MQLPIYHNLILCKFIKSATHFIVNFLQFFINLTGYICVS